MFAKLIGAVVVTVIAATIPETRSFAVWIFLIAIIVVFVIEGVRVDALAAVADSADMQVDEAASALVRE